jgi:hypothetical protein
MKRVYVLCLAVLGPTLATAAEPAVEQEFREVAENGCKNRNRDFIVQGMVSNATENTLVLAALDNSRLTLSVELPGRGPFAGLRGAFGKSREERVDEKLNQLRDDSVPVVVTFTCKGDATPVARSITFTDEDGSRGSISY